MGNNFTEQLLKRAYEKKLSHREFECLDLYLSGVTVENISKTLFLTENYTRQNIRSAVTKLGDTDITSKVAKLRKNNKYKKRLKFIDSNLYNVSELADKLGKSKCGLMPILDRPEFLKHVAVGITPRRYVVSVSFFEDLLKIFELKNWDITKLNNFKKEVIYE